MQKNMFGRELEEHFVPGLTLDDFKDLMLFHLEDYLYHNKFNDKVTNIDIPFLGVHIKTEKRYALDLRKFFAIPQFSFDTDGCVYNNGEESAYVSPEFFAKCFIERVINVWTALSTLYLPGIKKGEGFEPTPVDEIEFEKQFPHMDFVDIYNKLVAIKRINNDLTKGLIGLIPDYRDNDRILNLRKIEFAAQVQKDIEAVIELMREDAYQEKLYNFNNNEFWESDEFKKLDEEHSRLFRMGPFVDALEIPEWQERERSYDEGTDEERAAWRQSYNSLKEEYELKGLEKIKSSVSTQLFPLSVIQDNMFDYLKRQILTYNYERNVGAPGNPYINELGLDKTGYYAHPSDKYIPEKTSPKASVLEFDDVSSDDYDMLYGTYSDYDEDEFQDSTYKGL